MSLHKTILVAYATKHGSTKEIAESIGATLEKAGLTVTIHDMATDLANTQFDAYVIGSAVYAGNWMATAKTFIANRKDQLTTKPVWLFSSGTIGNPPRPNEDDAVKIDDLLAAIQPQDHRLFTGNLDKSKLNLAERTLIRAINIQYGDFRNWYDITAWASDIATALKKQ